MRNLLTTKIIYMIKVTSQYFSTSKTIKRFRNMKDMHGGAIC